MKIAIGSDHRGFDLKARLSEMLTSGGYDVVDIGAESTDSADYPDYAFPVAEMVASGKADRGILIWIFCFTVMQELGRILFVFLIRGC